MHSISTSVLVLFGLMVALLLIFCAQSYAQVGIGISVNFAPLIFRFTISPFAPAPTIDSRLLGLGRG